MHNPSWTHPLRGCAVLSPAGGISLPVVSTTGWIIAQGSKPGGRHISQSVQSPMCRPPGFNTHWARFRWFTPPAGKCRPPG